MKQKIYWDEPIILFGRTERSGHNDLDDEGHENLKLWNKKVDFSERLAEIPPEEFPIDEWSSKIDFENWLQEQFGGYQDGVYYLFTRCITTYSLQRKKRNKEGRPKYSYSFHGNCNGKRTHLRYGKPYRRKSGKWTCVAKFEMEGNQIISVPEKREIRKYAPYTRSLYPVIKAIQKQ